VRQPSAVDQLMDGVELAIHQNNHNNLTLNMQLYTLQLQQRLRVCLCGSRLLLIS
jgi:hypothetical protein